MQPNVASVPSFSTHWEAIIDFFDVLQAAGLSCTIEPFSEDCVYLLDELDGLLAQRCIDLSNEHDIYVYVSGICILLEAQWERFACSGSDEDHERVVTALEMVMSHLQILRPYLPAELFIRFLA